MNRLHSPCRPIIAFGLLLALAACASLFGNALEGTVLEQGTNKPIPGAIVIVRWGGALPAFAEARSVCVHVETATTDTAGHYRTPSWRAPSDLGPAPAVQAHIGPGAYAYKPGYAYVDTQGETIYLKPFTGTRGERFQSLWRIFSATGCDAAGRSGKNLFPLYKAVYEESKPLAATEEEKRLLRIMRELAASAWIAEDNSRSTSEEQILIREYLRDHLP